MYGSVLCIAALLTLIEAHVSVKKVERIEPLSDEMISYINQHPDAGWKSEKSTRFLSLDDARMMMGARKEDPVLQNKKRPTVDHSDWNVEIPSSFDA
ncbi:unnamed protein product [Schistosoma turkestanicum]|nr:unnamed protein product [Schistosoma turkestanicum]